MGRAFSRTLFERNIDLYKLTPTERYRKFVDTFPNVAECILIKELASYPQMPQYLRRIIKVKTPQKYIKMGEFI